MPLKPGKSKKRISENIREFHHGATYKRTLHKFGKERADAQAIAASYAKAGKSRRKKRGRH